MLHRLLIPLLVTGATLWPTATAAACDGPETLCGDGGPATSAALLRPGGLAVNSRWGILVADTGNDVIRRITPDGVIRTVAGLGVAGFGGDNGRASVAQLNAPADVAVAPDATVLIADAGNHAIRRLSVAGRITTVAGRGSAPPTTAPAPARNVRLVDPRGVAALGSDVLIADRGANRVLRMSAYGKIRVVAGTGAQGASGDGGPATQATLNGPTRVLATPDGGFDVLDMGNARVRHVDAAGVISAVPGGSVAPFTLAAGDPPDGGLARDAAGNRYVTSDRQIVRITPGGVAEVLAGTNDCGSTGDGGPAPDATFATPNGVAATPGGDVLVVDAAGGFASGTVRRVAGGTITALAGPSGSGAQACVGAGGAPTGGLWPTFYITAPRSARVRTTIRITFSTSQRATVTTALLQGARTVRSVKAAAARGSNTVALSGVSKAGRYTMRITASRDLPNNNPDAGGMLHVPKIFQAGLTVTR